MPAIRALAPDEAQLMRTVRLSALTDSPDAFALTAAQESRLALHEWEQRLADGDSVVLVALEAGRGVGMAGVRWFDAERGIAQLWGVWVEPGWRGTGLGRRLVDAARARASAHGARFLRLGIVRAPVEPTGFYERLGFVHTGEERPLPQDPARQAFWMVRPI